MEIVVRRSGGFAGMTRSWRLDTDAAADRAGWESLVGSLPGDRPEQSSAPVPDDFSWTITVGSRTVTVPGRELREPWSTVAQRVRDEGDPA